MITQENTVLYENGQIICLKQNHHEPVTSLIIDDTIPIGNRFLCSKCLSNKFINNPNNKDIINLEDHIVARHFTQVRSQKQFILCLQHLQFVIEKLKSQLIQLSDITQSWILSINNMLGDNEFSSIINEIERQFKGEFIPINDDKMYQLNKTYSEEINKIINQLSSSHNYKECFDILEQIANINSKIEQGETYQITQKIIPQNQNDLGSKQEVHWCWAIAFNKNGSLMVSGYNESIKIWKNNDGVLKEYKYIHTNHTNHVHCLIFSKKYNWFISGSADCTINLWKEVGNSEWIHSHSKTEHLQDILCIVLNSNEDQLLSCSYDKSIKAWKVNYLENKLVFDYTLEQMHSEHVTCISLNEQDTALVSCSFDKKIILWIRDKQNKWIYQNHISNDDYGNRISFISEYQIVWQQKSYGITHVFQIENGKLIKTPLFSISLNQFNEDDWLFPTIYNTQRQIIVQKHNKFVYILKKKENGELFKAAKVIDCQDLSNFGSLTQDGQYLVIWVRRTRQFQVYNLKYF